MIQEYVYSFYLNTVVLMRIHAKAGKIGIRKNICFVCNKYILFGIPENKTVDV